VGEEALEGLQGVEHVSSDFHDATETNIVWYDPALTGVDQMEKALKDAGTYLGTAK
jgi:copper chaperone CopZ